MSNQVINTSGRRKTAVARVYLKPGSGKIVVNNREMDAYFKTATLRQTVVQPFSILALENQFDVQVNVSGGGFNGQAEATRLAISKALVELDAANKSPLSAQSLLTRDPRMVERKKPGQKKARKRFQFSKR